MCKSKYKNINPSTLYLLRAVHSLVEKSNSDLSFFQPALDLDIATITRYLVVSRFVHCPVVKV